MIGYWNIIIRTSLLEWEEHRTRETITSDAPCVGVSVNVGQTYTPAWHGIASFGPVSRLGTHTGLGTRLSMEDDAPWRIASCDSDGSLIPRPARRFRLHERTRFFRICNRKRRAGLGTRLTGWDSSTVWLSAALFPGPRWPASEARLSAGG